MSRWTHSICDDCWTEMNGDLKPIRVILELRGKEACCFCGAKHESGIFTRGDPADVKCGGEHSN